MEGEEGVVCREHPVNGVTQFVRHRRHIVHAPLIIEFYPGGEFRRHAPAERAALFPFADFAIDVFVFEDAARQFLEARRKLSERVHDRIEGFFKGIAFVRLDDRRVDVVAAEAFHPQMPRLQAEVPPKDFRVFLAGFQQRIYRLVGDVVHQVPRGDGGGESAEDHVFVSPVARDVLIHLPQNRSVLAIDAVQLLIGAGAEVRVAAADVGHQLAASQFFRFALDLQFEDVAVGDGIVKIGERVRAGDVFEIDDFLFRFGEGVGLEEPHFVEKVTVIARSVHQAGGVRFIQIFPP